MKNFMRICCALLLAVAMLSGAALAASSVTYEGGAEKFVFLPGSEYSDSDLFENFKNVLPGDVIEQKITVKNTSGKNVRIYMRAEAVEEKDVDFLSQMTLNVVSNAKEIFDDTADQRGALTENTLLGTFKQNGSAELTVTLTVPADLGNEYMGRQGTVPWTFLVEEIIEEDTPETGDNFQLIMWVAAAAVLASGILCLLLMKRKRGEA